MTVISANSAALTILTQSTSFAQNASGNAADAILDIVSGRATTNSTTTDAVASATAKAKASEKVADAPRGVGGSVSSEISPATMSATSAAVVNSFNYDDPLIAFTPVKPSAENAEVFARSLLNSARAYNAQFNLKTSTKEDWENNVRSFYNRTVELNIRTQEEADAIVKSKLADEDNYLHFVSDTERLNQQMIAQAGPAMDMIESASARLKEVFGIDVQVGYDEKGEITIGSFEIFDDRGQKMLSHGADGSLAVTAQTEA